MRVLYVVGKLQFSVGKNFTVAIGTPNLSIRGTLDISRWKASSLDLIDLFAVPNFTVGGVPQLIDREINVVLRYILVLRKFSFGRCAVRILS